jgi:hypothetical protein
MALRSEMSSDCSWGWLASKTGAGFGVVGRLEVIWAYDSHG